MANNKKTAPTKKAPAAPAAPNNNQQVKVLDMTEFVKNVQSTSIEGLDPNRRVDLLRILHETFRMDPNAAEKYHMPAEAVAKINEITAIGEVAALACEIAYAKNPFAIKMNISQLEAIKEVGSAIGVSIDTKLLSAPSENGVVEVSSEAVKVEEETKTQIKKEEEIRNKQVEIDPSKIENDEQFKEAANKVMITRDNFHHKLSDTIDLYKAYRGIQASKSENKEEELKKLNSKSRIELFREIIAILGSSCSLVVNGAGRFMYTIASQTKSPIVPFCMLRNSTKNRKTGVYALTDEEVADYVRILIEWANNIKIADEKKRLEGLEKNLETLKKDEKKNATGIADTQEKIKIAKNNLKHFNDVLSYVMNPSSEVPANLMKDYSAKDAYATKVVNCITDSYYDDVILSEMKPDGLRHNIEQYAGIIINLFRDPAAKIEKYRASNIIPLEPISTEEKSDEAPAAQPATEQPATEQPAAEAPAEEPKKE